MASSPVDKASGEPEQEIRLVDSGEMWIATDVETGVTSQGATRADALSNLDEAVALHREQIGESVEPLENERDVLREFGIDPDEVEQAREESDDLPEFMR
ncbi:MAG: type II toxin-antitoxin system HicB family antitoxin [Halobacteriales archaeon]